jgi:hypothetical protein
VLRIIEAQGADVGSNCPYCRQWMRIGCEDLQSYEFYGYRPLRRLP